MTVLSVGSMFSPPTKLVQEADELRRHEDSRTTPIQILLIHTLLHAACICVVVVTRAYPCCKSLMSPLFISYFPADKRARFENHIVTKLLNNISLYFVKKAKIFSVF